MDGDISPDNLVDGKRLEGNGPGNNDVWQEDRYPPNELARDGSLEADEIRREQRQGKYYQVDEPLADLTENATDDRIHLSVPLNHDFSWGRTWTS
jgi:hypothetical protein